MVAEVVEPIDHTDVMETTLLQLAAALRTDGVEAVTFSFPVAKIQTANTSQYGAMMDWSAQLEMFVGESDLNVVVGLAEFVTVRLGDEGVVNMLDSHSADAESFAPLFAGRWLANHVEDQFEGAGGHVLILLNVEIAAPLRGHRLGAWLAAEVIYRMLPAGLVVLTPYPSEGDTDEMSVATLQAIETLSQYWQTTIGVEPITGTNCLGQTAAYIHLDAARTNLQSVQDADITVTVAELEQSADRARRFGE